jgi:hypothetical protein
MLVVIHIFHGFINNFILSQFYTSFVELECYKYFLGTFLVCLEIYMACKFSIDI